MKSHSNLKISGGMMKSLTALMTLILLITPVTFAGDRDGGDDMYARLQVIHNSADPAASVVDIYVNGSMYEDDFAFREATEFRDVPAGVELNIGIAPGNSESADDALVTIPVTLTAGKTYVAIANGVIGDGFAENPDNKSIGFNLFAKDRVKESSRFNKYVAVLAFHGSTDAPTVDILKKNQRFNWPLFNNLSYGEFSYYRYLKAEEYIISLTPGDDNETVVATYKVDLTGLGGGAAVVFASGFFDPSANNDGPAFGLFAALPDGTVVELMPDMENMTARLQVIHNAADPAAEVVDLYVNGNLYEDDFAFREATEFHEVPAGVELNIGVAPGNSASADDALVTIPVTLENNKTYVAVANGVIGDGFAENPDGQAIGFQLFANDMAKTESEYDKTVRIMAFHGATDAPTVDVVVRNKWFRWPLINDLTYGEFSGYAALSDREYILDVTPGNGNSSAVASYRVDLSGLGGGAAVVFASGFLNPMANNDGPAFGLFAALPDGTVVEFPQYFDMARLQVIHNAADPAAESVDLYVNGALYEDDFDFREATEFRDVPAGVTLNIGVAPGNSSSADDALVTIPVTLEANKTYVAIANGVIGEGFSGNPDGREIGISLFAQDNIREEAYYHAFVKLIAFHGASDAPTVDVRIGNEYYSWALFDDLTYGEFSKYRTVLPKKYMLKVTPGNDPQTVVAEYIADLNGLGGGAAVVFASGFLNPAENSDGPAFGLYAALPNGTVVELPAVGSDDDGEEFFAGRLGDEQLPAEFALNQNYPNPFNPTTTISFALPAATNVTLKVYNMLGQTVETLIDEPMEAGVHQINFDASSMASGMYFYNIKTDNKSETRKMVLLK